MSPRILLNADSEKSPERTSYVIAAWCYVNAFIKPVAIEQDEDLQRALDDLYVYFGRSRDYDSLYLTICEKAMILSVFQIETVLDDDDLWPVLMSRKKRFDKVNANGYWAREIKNRNRIMVNAIHVSCRYVLRYVQQPNDTVRDECNRELEEIDSQGWIIYFDAAVQIYKSLSRLIY